MSSLFSGLTIALGIITIITFVVAGIVKLILYLSGKPITTQGKRTRKLLLYEFVGAVCSFLLFLLFYFVV